jgi:hypothetical protein
VIPDKETLEAESATLEACPFCGGKAEFYASKNEKALLCIRHRPESGVVCPALYDQFCETFEMGRSWWNKRFRIP